MQEIRQLISDQHWAFVANSVGPDAVPPDILESLKERGLVDPEVVWPKEAYQYGQAMAASKDPKFKDMTLAQFRDWVRKNPPPLSNVEQRAIEQAKIRCAEAITMMGDRMRNEVVGEVVQSIQGRTSTTDLKIALGHLEEDWTRNWHRVSVTEKHNAMMLGLASQIRSESGDALVAIRAMPDACEHCKRLHVGPDGQPRIFRLSQLEANGTNVGRKARDWLPVVGPVHPNCQCQLFEVPEGYGFEEDGTLSSEGKLGVVYEGPEDVLKAIFEEMTLQKAYKLQGELNFQGLDIAIENAAGTERSWKDASGNEGSTYMQYGYGYVRRTRGADGDEVDVFVGPDPRAPMAYIVAQQTPDTGIYDEDKVMLGFPSEAQALEAYRQHYNRLDFDLFVSPMEIGQFKQWVDQTYPESGHMAKSGPDPDNFENYAGEDLLEAVYFDGPRLVIPLAKAKISELPADLRADKINDRNPALFHGDGMNQLFNLPLPAKIEPNKDLEAWLKEWTSAGESNAHKVVDMESDWAMKHSARKLNPQGLAEDLLEPYDMDPKADEGRRSMELRLQNKKGVRNTAPVTTKA